MNTRFFLLVSLVTSMGMVGCAVDGTGSSSTSSPAPSASAPQVKGGYSIPASAETRASLGVASWIVRPLDRPGATLMTGLDAQGKVVVRWWSAPRTGAESGYTFGDAKGGVMVVDSGGRVLRSSLASVFQARLPVIAQALHVDVEARRQLVVPYDACSDARTDYAIALAAEVAAGIAVVAACATPEPAEPIACAAAVAALVNATAAASVAAQRVTDRCGSGGGGGGGGGIEGDWGWDDGCGGDDWGFDDFGIDEFDCEFGAY